MTMPLILRSLTVEREEAATLADALDLLQSRVDVMSPEWRHIENIRGKVAATRNSFPGVSDADWHAANAIKAQTDPEAAMADLDARYHDGLPEGANCRACGIEHAPINPSAR